MESAQDKFISYFLVLGCSEIETSHFDGSTTAKIKIEHRYPSRDYPDAALPELFPMFCFPGGAKIYTEMKEPTFFCFTLTELSGERFYGACLTFYEYFIDQMQSADKIEYHSESESENSYSTHSEWTEVSHNSPEGSTFDCSISPIRDDKQTKIYVPKCLAILSRHAYFSTFRECLREIFLLFRTQSAKLSIEHYISYLLHSIPLPPPSYTVQFQLYNKKILVSTPPANFFSLMEFSVTCLFDCLGIKGVLEVFSYILTEQKVVFCSQHYTLLTIAAETITQLIFPFQWHHIYIPILPNELLEFLEAPTPFIIGVHIDLIDRLQEISGIVIVDLDNGKINNNSIKSILPPAHTAELIKKLETILHPQLNDMDAAFPKAQHLFYSTSNKSSNAMQPTNGEIFNSNQIRLSFLQFFIDLFCNFRNYISFLKKYPQPVAIFNKAKYIKENIPSAAEFLSAVLETQAFSMLLENQHQEFTIFEVVIRAQQENIPLSALWHFNNPDNLITIPPLCDHSPIEIPSQKKQFSIPFFPTVKLENYPKPPLANCTIIEKAKRTMSEEEIGSKLMNKFRRSTRVQFEAIPSVAAVDPAQQFIEDCLLLILKEQVIPNESLFLLSDLVKLEQSRLVVVRFLKSYSDKMKGSITDLSPQYFNYLSGITQQLLEEAKSSNDFTSPAILMASSGSFRLINTDEFLHQRFKKHSIFHNKYFWESAFFESVAREREALPDEFKVGVVNSYKWEDLSKDVQIEYESREVNILFGLLGSFAMHMLNLGVSAKEASNFLQQMSRLCDLASEQVNELQTLVATMQQINEMINEDLDLVPNPNAANTSNSYSNLRQNSSLEIAKESENNRLEYFATSSSNDNFDSKSLYRRLMEQKVKKETEQFSVEKEKGNGFLIRTLKGYRKGISCMALHYPILATGEVNGAITLWNLIINQTLNFKLNYHVDRITALIINSNYLICSSLDSNISVWNIVNGELEHKFTAHSAAVNCISLFGNKLVSGSDDNSIRVWNLSTGECSYTLKGHIEPVTSIKIENNFIVSGSKDQTVKVWDDWECRSTLAKHKDWIKMIDFNDNIIISASYDTTILIWDRHTRQLLRSLIGHMGIVNCFDFNESILVSGSSDHTVRVWDINTGNQINVFQESERGDEISSVKIHPNTHDIIAGGFDGFIRIWNLKTGKLSCLSGHTDWVYTLIVHLIHDYSNDDKKEKDRKDKKDKKEETMQTFLIISGSWDNTVKIWEQNIIRQSKNKKSKKKKNFKFLQGIKKY